VPERRNYWNRSWRDVEPPRKTPAAAEPASLFAAHGSADPRARLQALEDWARGARETLDPVTYALVDPDEAVRVRAQALVEGVWAAKAEAGAR
jgi:hypothetical protein